MRVFGRIINLRGRRVCFLFLVGKIFCYRVGVFFLYKYKGDVILILGKGGRFGS